MKNVIIKGRSFRFNKLLLISLATAFLTLYMVYLVLFDQHFNSQTDRELFLSFLGMISMTAFFYWMLSFEYYYYELCADHIEVRNTLRPYHKILPYSGLVKIKVSGYQSIFRNLPDDVEFIYQPNDERKNFKFASFGFTEEDWKLLLATFKNMNLPLECSHHFFGDA